MMKRNSIVKKGLTFGVISFFLLAGCAGSMGSYSPCNDTQVQLSEANYRIIQSGVTGESQCWYFLSLIPAGNTELYKMAMDNLRSKIKVKDKSIAIVNVTQDLTIYNYILMSGQRLTITADIVEFTE